MARLLSLPRERIDAERAHALEQAALDAAWRRRLRAFALRCAAVYSAGAFLAFGSMGLTGDAAPMALWGGFLLGNGAILVFLLTVWARHE